MGNTLGLRENKHSSLSILLWDLEYLIALYAELQLNIAGT